MDIKEFKSKIQKNLGEITTNPEFETVVNILSSVAEAIEEEYSDAKIKIGIEPGFTSNLGRQMNLVMRIKPISFREVLFRAYIPTAGFPVQLDLFGEDLQSCTDKDELQEQILDFLQRDDVSQKIHALAIESSKFSKK